MSDLLTQNGSEPFTMNLDGAEIRLAKVTPKDWIDFRYKFRTFRKVQYTQSQRFSGVTGDALEKKLEEFDARKLRQSDVIEWILDLEGAAELLAMSVSRGFEIIRDGKVEKIEPAKRGIEDIPAIIPHDAYTDAAAGVGKLRLIPETIDPKTESAEQIETGGAKPTESDTGSTQAA